MNLRPSGYEPDELPGCSTPRQDANMLDERAARDRYLATPGVDGKCVMTVLFRAAFLSSPPSALAGGNFKYRHKKAAADATPRRPSALRRAVPQTDRMACHLWRSMQNGRPFEGAAVSGCERETRETIIVEEEKQTSLAGLAATYSSKS